MAPKPPDARVSPAEPSPPSSTRRAPGSSRRPARRCYDRRVGRRACSLALTAFVVLAVTERAQ